MEEVVKEVVTGAVIIFGTLLVAYTIMEIPLNIVKLASLKNINHSRKL